MMEIESRLWKWVYVGNLKRAAPPLVKATSPHRPTKTTIYKHSNLFIN